MTVGAAMFGAIELTNPSAPPFELTPEQRKWFLLAEIAFRLDEARKKQEKIKRVILHSVQNYKRLQRKRKAA